MIDKNYWLNEWRKMMCDKMPLIDDMSINVHCNTPDGVVTCAQCRYKGSD